MSENKNLGSNGSSVEDVREGRQQLIFTFLTFFIIRLISKVVLHLNKKNNGLFAITVEPFTRILLWLFLKADCYQALTFYPQKKGSRRDKVLCVLSRHHLFSLVPCQFCPRSTFKTVNTISGHTIFHSRLRQGLTDFSYCALKYE